MRHLATVVMMAGLLAGCDEASRTDTESSSAAPKDQAARSVANAGAGDGLVRTTSSLGVAATLDNLEAAVKQRGFTVMARLKHSEGAKKVGMDLRPTQLLIFGNPKGGTPLMQAAPSLALDLPLKVAAYRGDDGATHLVYNDPAWMLSRHGLGANRKAIDKLTGLLKTVTAEAGQANAQAGGADTSSDAQR